MSNKHNHPGTPTSKLQKMNSTPSNNVPSSPVSNEDIMTAILSAKTAQTQQFEKLYSLNNMELMASDIAILKTENAALRTEISILKAKVEDIKSSVPGSGNVAIQILRESSERRLRDHNAIVYGLTESSASTGCLRASDDKEALLKILTSVSIPFTTDIKLFRVGSDSANRPRPLKVCFRSSNDVNKLINNFNLAMKNGHKIPNKFHIGRDRTFLEREVLQSAYAELDQRKQAGESNLVVACINNIPSVTKLSKKNRIPRSQHSRQDRPQL